MKISNLRKLYRLIPMLQLHLKSTTRWMKLGHKCSNRIQWSWTHIKAGFGMLKKWPSQSPDVNRTLKWCGLNNQYKSTDSGKKSGQILMVTEGARPKCKWPCVDYRKLKQFLLFKVIKDKCWKKGIIRIPKFSRWVYLNMWPQLHVSKAPQTPTDSNARHMVICSLTINFLL